MFEKKYFKTKKNTNFYSYILEKVPSRDRVILESVKFHWLVGWLVGWLIDWLIDWLVY